MPQNSLCILYKHNFINFEDLKIQGEEHSTRTSCSSSSIVGIHASILLMFQIHTCIVSTVSTVGMLYCNTNAKDVVLMKPMYEVPT